MHIFKIAMRWLCTQGNRRTVNRFICSDLWNYYSESYFYDGKQTKTESGKLLLKTRLPEY